MKLKKLISCAVILCLSVLLLAGCAGAGATADSGTAGAGIPSLVMMVVMFAILYFLMIRPENKRKKKTEEMRNSIAVGDKIVTIGGITGKVVHVTEDRITFETGEDRVRLEVTKWAISSNEGRGADKETVNSEEVVNNN